MVQKLSKRHLHLPRSGFKPIPHITQEWITASFTKVEDRTEANQKPLQLSNILLNELKEADIYVIGVPMYNWSIPSGLKAYIDHIMRINETWKFRSGEPDGDYVGLLHNKKLFILSSRGDMGTQKANTMRTGIFRPAT